MDDLQKYGNLILAIKNLKGKKKQIVLKSRKKNNTTSKKKQRQNISTIKDKI